jgi:hypothetical protein
VLDWLLRRWHLKVLAFALAFAVWIAVIGEGRSVSDYHVPMDVTLAPDAALTGTLPPSNVTVRLRGPESLLRRLDAFDLSVRVDLRDAVSGEQTVALTQRNVAGVPRDVEVALLEPDRLRVTVAHKKRRELPVTPTLVGKPPRGYYLYRAVARPETLEVEGPDTKLAATRLRTDPIRLDDQREAFVARVGAFPDAPNTRVSDTRPLDVTVYIDLAPVSAVIERVPVVVVGAGGPSTVVPSVVNVTVSAPSSLLPKLRAGHVRAVADAGPADTAQKDAPIRIEFPGLDPDERAKVTVQETSFKKATIRRSGR